MIPMFMRYEYENITAVFLELIAKFLNATACIQYKGLRIDFYANTRGVPTIPDCGCPRTRYGSAYTPESDSHVFSRFLGSGPGLIQPSGFIITK
jgi:hypothetical protein